jgi:hypothetical protein
MNSDMQLYPNAANGTSQFSDGCRDFIRVSSFRAIPKKVAMIGRKRDAVITNWENGAQGVKDFRSVFHDASGARRDGAQALDRVPYSPGIRWLDPRGKQNGLRYDLYAFPAKTPGVRS